MKNRQSSKKLSWLLRHGATEAGVAMDAAGWVSIDAVLKTLGIDRSLLEELVRTNTKKRLQIEGERIRACQGHSWSVPVTLEALEASWAHYKGEAAVWHGTFVEAVASIAAQGVLPQKRTHVHLAPQTESVVGKRANVHVMLGISPARMRDAEENLYVAPNGVVLARSVPSSCVVDVRCITKKARQQEPALRALFGSLTRT